MNIALQEEVTQVFSCEFCEIFKNTCFTQQLLTTASRNDSNNFKGSFSNKATF